MFGGYLAFSEYEIMEFLSLPSLLEDKERDLFMTFKPTTLIIVYKKHAIRKTSLNLRKNKKQGLVLFVKFRNKIERIR